MPNSVISAVVSVGCENWPLTLREDQRLKILETRIVMNIFELKRKEVTESRRSQ